MNFKSTEDFQVHKDAGQLGHPRGVKCIVGFLAITADAYTSGHLERTWQVPKMRLIGTALGRRLMICICSDFKKMTFVLWIL